MNSKLYEFLDFACIDVENMKNIYNDDIKMVFIEENKNDSNNTKKIVSIKMDLMLNQVLILNEIYNYYSSIVLCTKSVMKYAVKEEYLHLYTVDFSEDIIDDKENKETILEKIAEKIDLVPEKYVIIDSERVPIVDNKYYVGPNYFVSYGLNELTNTNAKVKQIIA